MLILIKCFYKSLQEIVYVSFEKLAFKKLEKKVQQECGKDSSKSTSGVSDQSAYWGFSGDFSEITL